MEFQYWARRTMGLSHKWHRAKRLDIGIGGISALFQTACGMVLGMDDAMFSRDLAGSFLTCAKCERRMILNATKKITETDRSQTKMSLNELGSVEEPSSLERSEGTARGVDNGVGRSWSSNQ